MDIEEHVRGEHSTLTWLIELVLERARVHDRAGEYSPDGIFAAYSSPVVLLRRISGHR